MPTTSSNSRDLWNKIASLGNGAVFTIPQIRKHFPKNTYSTVSGRVGYLAKIGMVEKINSWDGTNYVQYRVKDESRKPMDIHARFQGNKVPGIGLFKVKKKTSPNLVVAIDRMADQLTGLLQVAKEHPQATVKNFSTKELWDELAIRTQPTA